MANLCPPTGRHVSSEYSKKKATTKKQEEDHDRQENRESR